MNQNNVIPIDYDRMIGQRLKEARLSYGVTCRDASKMLGVSYQQFQKYEKGSNRISAKSLFVLSREFGHPMEWFTEKVELTSQVKAAKPRSYFMLKIIPMLQTIDDDRTQALVLEMVKLFTDSATLHKGDA